MKSKNKNLEIKEANIFLSTHESIIKDEGVFGLGRSKFNPSTNTVQVMRYSSNPIELLIRNSFYFLPFCCTTFCHEIGHYYLTLGSRLGTIIKDMNMILDGICLTIIKRMIKKHRKIWIPFGQYLQMPNRDAGIERLILSMLRLDEMENKLVKNWKISQELFAYSWTGLLSTFPQAIWASMFGEKDRENLLKRIASLSFFADYEKMNEINEKLRQFFMTKGIKTEEIGEKEIKKVFENLDEIFGAEKDIVEGFLKSIELTYAYANKDRFSTCDILMEKFLDEHRIKIDKEFKKSYEQHVEALKIFRNYSKKPMGDMLKIIGSLLGISCLFAPIIDPKFIKDVGTHVEIKNIDQLSKDLIQAILAGRINFHDFDSIISFVTMVQDKTGSVKTKDLNNIPLSHILGTRQWFSEIIANLDLNRNERKLIKNLMISNRAIDLIYNSDTDFIAYESLVSLLPMSFKSIIRIAFAFREKLKKLKPIKPVVETLEKLNIHNAKTLFSLLEIYQDILFSFPVAMLTEKSERKRNESIFPKPSFAIYMNNESLTLYSSKDFSTYIGKLTIYKHIVGNLRELCLKGIAPQTLCPISYLKDNNFLCKEGIAKCWLYKLLRMSAKSGDLLICCKDGEANFIRTYNEVDNPDLILRFRIDDRDAQIRGEEINLKKDIIEKILKHQVKRLNRFYKKETVEDEKYDGRIEDLYIYREKQLEKQMKRMIGFFSKLFGFFFIPAMHPFI